MTTPELAGHDAFHVAVLDPERGAVKGEVVSMSTERVRLQFSPDEEPDLALGQITELLLTGSEVAATHQVPALISRRSGTEDRRWYEFDVIEPDRAWGPFLTLLRELPGVPARARPSPGRPIPVTVVPESQRGELHGTTNDISVAGMAILVEGTVEADPIGNEPIRLTFDLDGDPIVVWGRITDRSLSCGGRRYRVAFDPERTGDFHAVEARIDRYVSSRQREIASRQSRTSATIQSKISRAMWMVTLGLIALAATTTLYVGERFARNKIAERLHDADLRCEDDVALRIRRMREDALSVARMSGLRAAVSGGESGHVRARMLAEKARQLTRSDLVVFVDPQGRVIANTEYPGTVRQRWTPESGFWESHDALFVTASAPVMFGEAKLADVFLGEKIDASFAAELRAVTHTSVFVVHRGRIVAASSDRTVDRPVTERELRQLIGLGDSAAYERIELAGEDRFVTVTRLGEHSFVALGVSVADVMSLYRLLILWVIGVALIVGCLSWWLSVFIAKGILHPLQNLTRQSRELADGDLSGFVQEANTKDIATLIESFNRMSQRIQQLLRDVSHTSRVVEEQRAQLVVANAKDEFLSRISHELQTPLTSIASFAEILLKFEAVDVAAQEEFLRIILDESLRMGRMIDQLLEQARVQDRDVLRPSAEMDLRDVVAGSVKVLARARGADGPAVTTSLPNRPCPFVGNEDQVRQVMTHLVGNAVKFSPAAGTVSVVLLQVDGGYEIRVADQGPGVRDQDKQRVFAKFEQGGELLTEKPSGMGLGLAICEQVVAAHDGEIHCEDNEGGGAVFVVSLPMRGPAEREVTAGSAPTPTA